MSQNHSNAIIDIQSLNNAIYPMVQAMFWGAVLTALAVPVAASIGTWVGGKIAKTQER